MSFLSGISQRIVASFGALVLIFGVAAAFNLAGLADIHARLHEVKEHEGQVREALELGSAIRDQYAHVAHTVILGNASHLSLYDAAHARVATLARDVGGRALNEQARESALGIARDSDAIDALFRTDLLAAVLRGDAAAIRLHHGVVLEQTARLEERARNLAGQSLASIGKFEEHAGAIQHSTYLWTLISLIAATLFAVAVGIYLGRSIADPVRHLGEGAARLGGGDLDTRIEVTGHDELGQLATGFNSMAAALKEHQARLVQTEKLAGLGRLAAGVAHEINNPLGVILGYSRLLRKTATAAQADDLKVIEDEALQCQHIVEGLLDLSRPIRIAPERLKLREICEEVAVRLRESHQLAAVTVSCEGDAVVEGDPHHLRQIALNLIKNGAEAAGPGGRVDVRVTAAADGVHLSVTDTGPGITPALRERLFEPFFTTKPSGTGLGLAMSQAMARAHGGTIEARPTAGGGATFTLRLPSVEGALG